MDMFDNIRIETYVPTADDLRGYIARAEREMLLVLDSFNRRPARPYGDKRAENVERLTRSIANFKTRIEELER